jgi:arylsulfatase A-like enzyme
MTKSKLVFAVLFSFLLGSIFAQNKDDAALSSSKSKPNILLIIADDLGKDAINGYTEGSIKPKTPNIDAIRNKGVVFNNFWVNPTCTPTRSSIITGKYGYRTGVKVVGDVLNSSEKVLQKYINENTNNAYATAVVGKWHLAGTNTNFNPESFGIDYYAGVIRGAVTDYYQWQLTEDGTTTTETKYTTEKFTDLAINWVNAQTKPWFLWLAYNAPHTPFHIPPSTMHSQGNLPAYTPGTNGLPYFMAAIEAMDYQIGRLLQNLPAVERANTIIIFMGDNGTPNKVAQSPYSSNKVKSTLYQGGINTPLFISGKGVSRTDVDNQLITGTDLFSTIAAVAGVNVTEYYDSKSFKNALSESRTIRQYQYSEIKDGTNDFWAISNGIYKLIVSATGAKQLYFLTSDPYEGTNLLNGTLTSAQTTAKNELEAELNTIRK